MISRLAAPVTAVLVRAARCAAAGLVLAALLAVPARSAAAPPAAATPVPMPLAPQLVPFRWLAGGIWRADLSGLPGGMKDIETRYEIAPTGVILFASAFVKPDGSIANGYTGALYFDAAAKRLGMWYVDAHGALTQGPVTLDGERWSMTFTSDGAIAGHPGSTPFRVDVERRSPDLYHWSLFADAGGGFKPVFALDYVRSAV
ncbi:MAG TPA: hypothetical protein VGC96_06240 [Candidatus Elarobacter sp.]|jgi:hypothetical protein